MQNEIITNYIKNAPEDLQEIMHKVRGLINQSVPDILEGFKWNQPVFFIDNNLFYLEHEKKQVNLGFFVFKNLKDPNNRLKGYGKRMRHLELFSMSDIDEDLFCEWFKTAAENA